MDRNSRRRLRMFSQSCRGSRAPGYQHPIPVTARGTRLSDGGRFRRVILRKRCRWDVHLGVKRGHSLATNTMTAKDRNSASPFACLAPTVMRCGNLENRYRGFRQCLRIRDKKLLVWRIISRFVFWGESLFFRIEAHRGGSGTLEILGGIDVQLAGTNDVPIPIEWSNMVVLSFWSELAVRASRPTPLQEETRSS